MGYRMCDADRAAITNVNMCNPGFTFEGFAPECLSAPNVPTVQTPTGKKGQSCGHGPGHESDCEYEGCVGDGYLRAGCGGDNICFHDIVDENCRGVPWGQPPPNALWTASRAQAASPTTTPATTRAAARTARPARASRSAPAPNRWASTSSPPLCHRPATRLTSSSARTAATAGRRTTRAARTAAASTAPLRRGSTWAAKAGKPRSGIDPSVNRSTSRSGNR